MRGKMRSIFVNKNYPAVIASGLLSIVILVLFTKMWEADFFTVLFDGFGAGSAEEQMKIQNLIETGSRYVSERLGGREGQALFAFIQSDALNYLLIRICLLFTNSSALPLNILFIFTFPAAAMTATYALCRLSVSKRMAIFSGTLYTFLYYHFTHNQNNIVASSYYLVPLGCLVLFHALRGELSFSFSKKKSFRINGHHNAVFIGAVVISFLLSSTGLDYAFFFCLLMLAALAKNFFDKRKWNRSLTGGIFCVCCTAFGVVLNYIPFFIYRFSANYQATTFPRSKAGADYYGMKILGLLLPNFNHRVPFFRHISHTVNMASPLSNENMAVSLGIVAALGFLLLLFFPIFIRRGKISERYTMAKNASYLVIVTLLLGTLAAVGSLISWVVTDRVKSYNRIVVFLAFFAFLAVSLVGDRIIFGENHGNEKIGKKERKIIQFFRTPKKWFSVTVSILLIPVFAGALFDQIPITSEIDYEVRSNFRTGNEIFFGQQIEDSVPEGTLVFQYPYIPYPEPVNSYGLNPYTQQMAYMFTSKLRWSSGAPVGFEEADWAEWVSNMGAWDAIQELKASGYGAICIYNWLSITDEVIKQRIIDYVSWSPTGPIVNGDWSMIFIPIE